MKNNLNSKLLQDAILFMTGQGTDGLVDDPLEPLWKHTKSTLSNIGTTTSAIPVISDCQGSTNAANKPSRRRERARQVQS